MVLLSAPAIVFFVVIVVGLAVTVPAYVSLLRRIGSEHPTEYHEMGSPTIFNYSPRISYLVQRFIYRDSKTLNVSPELARLCRFVGVVTPLLVAAVVAVVWWWYVDVIRAL